MLAPQDIVPVVEALNRIASAFERLAAAAEKTNELAQTDDQGWREKPPTTWRQTDG